MFTEPQPGKSSPKINTWMIWTGRALSVIPVLVLLASATFALTRPQQVTEGMSKFGYAGDKLFLIVTLEIVCALAYAFPRTAVLGAILMTAYFGGAVATHVRVGDPGYPMAVIMGIFVWAGLYLRDQRMRDLLPVRRSS
jgi:hypothetical protein